MNKTVTINLAGINFYIDEEAYKKLEDYLRAIASSLHEESRDETMQDIEGRIAELFLEKRQNKNEVIGLEEVQAVMAVLGQPEDFRVDETIFEENEPKGSNAEPHKTKKRPRKLYRDIDHNFIGGVCAGLSHYFDISIFWVRLLFLILLIPSGFTLILAYIILWALIPAALTTTEKLNMQGEKINIDNIERQVREGFSNLKNNFNKTDYSGVRSFFRNLETFLLGIGLFLAKAIGVLLLLIGGGGLLIVLFACLTAGTFSIFDAPWIDYVTAADIGVPFWGASVLLFLFLGIPLFFILLLGLKILVRQLKSIGNPAKWGLLGLWLLSLFAIAGFGIRQGTLRAFDAKVAQTKTIQMPNQDTLHISLYNESPTINVEVNQHRFSIKKDSSGQRHIFFDEVSLQLQPTLKNARLVIRKSASGNGFQQAKNTAQKIHYFTDFKKDTLFLANYFTTAIGNGFKEQEVELILYLPEKQVFAIDGTMRYFTRNIRSSYFDRPLKFSNNELECLDCPEETKQTASEEEMGVHNKTKALQSPKETPGTTKTESEWYQEK